ncbi:hypothetical protein HDE_08345 [Halotydeus destructor]|nr:hypothetical protein HDE_08345 [Halotydeus destructor]
MQPPPHAYHPTTTSEPHYPKYGRHEHDTPYYPYEQPEKKVYRRNTPSSMEVKGYYGPSSSDITYAPPSGEGHKYAPSPYPIANYRPVKAEEDEGRPYYNPNDLEELLKDETQGSTVMAHPKMAASASFQPTSSLEVHRKRRRNKKRNAA